MRVERTGPEARYADLVDEILAEPGVGPPGDGPPGDGCGFGRTALRFRNKIFAMFVRGRVVVELPAARVDELMASGDGVRFDAGKGTPMKEWINLDPHPAHDWPPLAREALAFARSSR